MQMDVAKAIETLVLVTLPKFSPEDVLLHLCIIADANVFKNDDQFKVRRQIHLLFHRPSNYTKVFWHIVKDDHQLVEKIPSNKWELESDHDSCWTSDGLQSPMNKVHDEIVNQFDEADRKKISWHVNFDIFGGFHIFEGCKVERVPGIEHYQRQYIVTLGKIKSRLSI